MDVVTKYTDFLVFSPDWFIDFIQGELDGRDLPGLTNDRIKTTTVSGEHPLVSLVGSIFTDGTPNFSGRLPAISVMDSDETEDGTTIGQGKRAYNVMDQTLLDAISSKQIKERYFDGLISDDQIQTIQTAIDAETNNQLLLEVEEFYQRESVFVSLWAHSKQELNIIGSLLRSILYEMKKEMLNLRLLDTKIKTDKGLINTNFGKILYGQETQIEYRNAIRNYTVYSGWEDHEVHLAGNFINKNDDKTVNIDIL